MKIRKLILYNMIDNSVSQDSETKRVVTQFHYIDWPENRGPHNPTELLGMTDQLQKWQQATGDNAITIHCK